MIEKRWEERFQPWILERGRNYWKENCVRTLCCTEDCIAAKVSGSGEEVYDVEILLEDGAIAQMRCTCPYAAGNDSCKHMAAVLFAAEVQGTETGSEQDAQYKGFPWREELERLEADELRKILTDLAAKDQGLQERLVLRRQDVDSRLLWSAWKEQVHRIIRQNTGRRGYIDYDHAGDFYTALDDFLDDRIPILLEAGKTMDAFRLVILVYTTAMEQGAEEDHAYDLLTRKCHALWSAVLDTAPEEQCEKFYRWFVEHLEESTWAFGTEDMEEFLFTYAWRGDLLLLNLKILDERIRVCLESESGYGLQELLLWRENMMKRQGCSPEEIQAFYRQYWDEPFVREREVERYLEKNAYDKAIELLEEGKTLDQKNNRQVEQHSEKLIELYRLTGQEEKYREELRFRVCSCYLRDLEYVKKLRKVLAEDEWPTLLQELLRQNTGRDIYYELLAYGEQWQRLFEKIRDKNRLDLMERYAKAMCGWAADKVPECYTEMLKDAMQQASNKNEYRRVVGYLSGLRDCPNGEEAVSSLVTYWRETFRRRSSMLWELERAGY